MERRYFSTLRSQPPKTVSQPQVGVPAFRVEDVGETEVDGQLQGCRVFHASDGWLEVLCHVPI